MTRIEAEANLIASLITFLPLIAFLLLWKAC